MGKHFIYILALLCMQAITATAQQTVVSGRVTDAATGEAMPYVNVVFKGTTIGASTNFDGYYSISTAAKVDSVIVSFMGYDVIVKPIKRGVTQTVDFQLEETISEVSEVVVTPGENPANKIIRRVDERRDFNEFKSLEAYQASPKYN
jgi:tRNA A22 N-methylase